MSAGLNLVLVGSAALFAVGAFALVARRSAIVMLLGTQFMFAAASIAFVAFGRFGLGARNQNAGESSFGAFGPASCRAKATRQLGGSRWAWK